MCKVVKSIYSESGTIFEKNHPLRFDVYFAKCMIFQFLWHSENLDFKSIFEHFCRFLFNLWQKEAITERTSKASNVGWLCIFFSYYITMKSKSFWSRNFISFSLLQLRFHKKLANEISRCFFVKCFLWSKGKSVWIRGLPLYSWIFLIFFRWNFCFNWFRDQLFSYKGIIFEFMTL